MRDSAQIDVTSVNGVMDEHEMTSGVIPLRHASLPGHVKLPRRYEKAAMGSSGIPVRVRKISIQPGQRVLGDSLSDRLDDLMAAILWVKQELIMLRQHDILLKRQFIDIQHSIHTLQKPKPAPPSSLTTTVLENPAHPTTMDTTTTTTIPNTSPTTTTNNKSNNNNYLSEPLLNGEVMLEKSEAEVQAKLNGRVTKKDPLEDSFILETFVVRPASSVTLLKDDSEEEDEEMDAFCEDLYFRPRTSSMRTSRDMAALARRRGSKELI